MTPQVKVEPFFQQENWIFDLHESVKILGKFNDRA